MPSVLRIRLARLRLMSAARKCYPVGDLRWMGQTSGVDISLIQRSWQIKQIPENSLFILLSIPPTIFPNSKNRDLEVITLHGETDARQLKSAHGSGHPRGLWAYKTPQEIPCHQSDCCPDMIGANCEIFFRGTMSVAECKLEILGMLRSASCENSTSSLCGGCGHPIDLGKPLRAEPASPRGLI